MGIYTIIWTLPKNLGNTTLTWFLKLLNRISALPPNLALGMKTHNITMAINDYLNNDIG